MKTNRIQFQPGLSMPEFFERYGSEAQCQAALQAARWPNAKYAHRYLAEFQFRFNHRFNMRTILHRLLCALVAAPPSRERTLRLAEIAR